MLFDNVLHCALGDIGSVPTQAQIDGLASGIYSAWTTTFLPLQANGLTLTEVLCMQLATTGGVTGVHTGSSGGGDISSGNLPNSAACCVSWIEGAHYRGGHPRTYLGGFKNGILADTRHFSAGFTSSMTSAANSFLSAVNALLGGNVWHLGCVHYHGKVLTTPGVPRFLPFTGATVNSRLDSQRRRLGKV
jgi:hypothetical protein